MPTKTITDPIDHKAHLLIGAWRFWSEHGSHTELVNIVGTYMDELNALLEQRYSIATEDTEIELDAPVDEAYVADALDDLSEEFEEQLDEIAEDAAELFAKQERKIQALIATVKAQHRTLDIHQQMLELLFEHTGLVTLEARQAAREIAGFAKGDRIYHVNDDNTSPRVGTVVSTEGGSISYDASRNYLRVLWDGDTKFVKEDPQYMRLADD